jgi:hypothetical protein
LNNYEIGDTLEYKDTNDVVSFDLYCHDMDTWIIINKEIFGTDSIVYTYKLEGQDVCIYNNNNNTDLINDTLKSTIINDSVYGNIDNFFKSPKFLYKFDTTGIGIALDSAYVKFDTINGLKRLRIVYNSSTSSPSYHASYEAIENIGLISKDTTLIPLNQYLNSTLVYAHLAHYGIYGGYKSIILNTNEPPVAENNISVRYDNSLRPWLYFQPGEALNASTLSVYDLLGRSVKTLPVYKGSNLIDISSLPNTIYLYKVESNGVIIGSGKVLNLRD